MRNFEENLYQFKIFYQKLLRNSPLSIQDIENIFDLIIKTPNRFIDEHLRYIDNKEKEKHNTRVSIYNSNIKKNSECSSNITFNLLCLYDIKSKLSCKLDTEMIDEINYNKLNENKHKEFLIKEENRLKEDKENINLNTIKNKKNFNKKYQCTYFDKKRPMSNNEDIGNEVRNFLKEINEEGDIKKHYKENLEYEKIPNLIKNQNYQEAIGLKKKDIEGYKIFLGEKIEKVEKMEEIIIALLNMKNSYLIYGVDLQTEKIVGLNMTRSERDIFKINMNKNFSDILFQYPENFKYKFYDVEDDEKREYDNLCILVVKINKMKPNSMVFERKEKKTYLIRNKILESKDKEMVQIRDIYELDNKGIIEFGTERLTEYYKNKYNLN